ncbi:MAG: OmpA family protein [Sandaracinaceae bacterium]|nr:OmpA family protein [Sandaracinaceae bacterium]
MSRRRIFASVTLALASLVSAPALAQDASVTVEQFHPAETAEDGFALSRPDDRGHLRVGAQLTLDYALNPLVYEDDRGHAESERFAIIEHQLAAHVGASLGLFDRVVLYVGLPVNLVMSGVDAGQVPAGFAAADGTGLGDLSLGGRVRLLGERNDLFALALQLTFGLPTALWSNATQRYSGEQGLVVHPELVGELRFGGGWRVTLDLEARLRAADQARLVDSGLSVSHELTYGLGLTAPLWSDAEGRSVTAHLEGFGAGTFEAFGSRELSPFEALLGVRGQPTCGLVLGLAGGTGLSRGYGTPDFRGVLSIGFSDSQCPVAPEVTPVAQPGDTDGDGILDPEDRCPTEPEDRDQFEDEDGCPDPDNDQDGILDVSDTCPNNPEDFDQFEDTDGCPEPDNDRDGILDQADPCPLDPEDFDRFEDQDGCPEPDNDRDTVLDPDDECPLAPGRPEDHGCPRSVRLDTETGQIFILQRVEFATNRDVILDRSFPILEEVRAVIEVNPQLRRLRVEGHTDDRGRDSANLDLSRRRAASVTRWLVEHGVDQARLEAWGCGEVHPMEDNGTADGRQANRRVEFHIIDPAPASGPRQLDGCLESDMSAPSPAARRRGRATR